MKGDLRLCLSDQMLVQHIPAVVCLQGRKAAKTGFAALLRLFSLHDVSREYTV